MSPFTAKQLETLTVGETLRQARERRGLTIPELARDTAINPRFIRALEQDRHHDLPGDVYVRHWFRALGAYLKLDDGQLLTLWLEERRTQTPQTRLAPMVSRAPLSVKKIRWVATILAIASTLAFLGVKLYAVVAPPPLAIASPAEALTTLRGVYGLRIEGRTAPEVAVTINRQPIAAALDGSFSQTVSLRPGINTITISAHRKNGFSASVQRTVVVKE